LRRTIIVGSTLYGFENGVWLSDTIWRGDWE